MTIIQTTLVIRIEKRPNDVAISTVAEDFEGKVADTFATPVVGLNVSTFHQQVKNLAEAFIQRYTIFTNHGV